MKFIVLISFVLLSLLKEYGADDTTKKITLLDTGNDEHQSLNKKLYNVANSIGFDVLIIYIDESGVLDTIRESAIHQNVINLRVSGFCNIDEYRAFLGSNLFCTTYIDPQALNFPAKKDNDTSSCNINGTQSITLVSESIIRNNRLFEIISDNDFELKDTVILCLPNYYTDTENIEADLKKQFIDISLVIKQDCESNLVIDSSVLAVVTPSTYGVESRVPMIIYNDPYILAEDKAVLPNSYNLMTSWYLLKYALIHFLKSMSWFRVAVLSDDSEYSAVFLDDLIPLLDEKGITYTSQHCAKRDCDFTDAAIKLQNAHTRIVVLNMNTKNAMRFVEYINEKSAQPVKWIVRDWPFMRNAPSHNNIDMFSITLSPVFEGVNKNRVKKIPQLSGIIESLENLRHAYKRALGDREKFTHYLSKQLTNNLRHFNVYAHITRKLNNNDFQVVASMMVRDSVITDVDYKDIYKNKPPPDFIAGCIARSRNYFKPCNHSELLLLLSVVIMFTLIILVVLLFYSKFSSNAYERLF